MATRNPICTIEEIYRAEKGVRYAHCVPWIALGYPASYEVGASSLGFQTVYRGWNETGVVSCQRFFFDSHFPKIPVTVETQMPVGAADAVAFSLACETDLLPAVEMLQRLNYSPLASQRTAGHPPIIIGGPLTLVDPQLVAPLADVVVCGESEDALAVIAAGLAAREKKVDFLAQLHKLSSSTGIWIPSLAPIAPTPHFVSADKLPAAAVTWSPFAGLKNLYLVEIARGCPRQCAFCLLAKTGRFRSVDKDVILSKIPAGAQGVGLVGAAVTDHPQLESIVGSIVESGRRVSLSSMRADRLTPQLLSSLVQGGLRSLTVAADGSSQEIRRQIKKGIDEQHLLDAAQMAKEAGLRGLKLYSMVGLPGESEADIREFASMVLELSKMIRLTIAIQAFVPKPNTPLADFPMTRQKDVKRRLMLLKRLVKGKVTIQSTSPRWSWVDWKLAHGGVNSANVAILANQNGGDFSAWKQAIGKVLENGSR